MRKGRNIYKRKDGRYEGRYKVFVEELNRYVYRSVYGKSYTEVKEKLESCKIEIITIPKKSDLTVKNLFDLFLENRKNTLKDSTYANYTYKLKKHILPVFGEMNYENMNAAIINEFIKNRLNENLSAKYIKDILSLLKSLGKYASKVHGYKNFFTDDVIAIKPKAKETECYNKINQTKLKSAFFREVNEKIIGFIICYFTGIRIGEICALKWENIDFDEGCIYIENTLQRIYDFDNPDSDKKTKIVITEPKSEKSKRVIPIPEFLCEFLFKFKSEDGHYVLSGSEKFVEPRLLQYHFSSFLKKENLPSINFHSLRHMFATNSIELGFDIKSLSEILGHSSVEITLNKYVHSSIERKRELMDKHKMIS